MYSGSVFMTTAPIRIETILCNETLYSNITFLQKDRLPSSLFIKKTFNMSRCWTVTLKERGRSKHLCNS